MINVIFVLMAFLPHDPPVPVAMMPTAETCQQAIGQIKPSDVPPGVTFKCFEFDLNK